MMLNVPSRTSKNKKLEADGSSLETLMLRTTRPSKVSIPRARTFAVVTVSVKRTLTDASSYEVFLGLQTKALSSTSSKASM
jgi:hypothetical protein